MQSRDGAQHPRTYIGGPPPPVATASHTHHPQGPTLPAISPVSPGLLQGGAMPPPPRASSSGARSMPSIPNIDELRSGATRGVTRLNAPNLTTYIEHYHYYHFAGNCTVYQAPADSRNSRSVQIVAEGAGPAPPADNPSAAAYVPGAVPPGGAHGGARGSTHGGHGVSHGGVHGAYGHQSSGALPPPSYGYMRVPAPLPALAALASSADVVDDGRLKRSSLSAYEQRAPKRTRALSLQSRADARSTSARAGSNSPPLGVASLSSSLSGGRAGSPPRTGRGSNESELMMNDWEHVVAMYLTGEGTADGRPLRDIIRGDGRRVEDRKLLEKRRTIGKTYERLGRELFERAIGYKLEGKYRRKQKMYHVIARCRIVNGLRKANEALPTDADALTALIDQRLLEKASAADALRRRPGSGPSSGSVVTGSGDAAPLLAPAPRGDSRPRLPGLSDLGAPAGGPSASELRRT